MLIEADKRGQEYLFPWRMGNLGSPASVPPNLFLLGLMNTADRSIAMLDYALRRRFAFYTLTPRFSSAKFGQHLEKRGATQAFVSFLTSRMEALNAEISEETTRLGVGYRIGHSYFVPAEPVNAAWYLRILKTEIKPLLEEYWFDNPGKAVAHSKELEKGRDLLLEMQPIPI